jgi:two-component system sensor histidine kinase UhpB
MRERALLIGARLEVGPAPEGGTRIRLQVPVTG